MDTFQNTELWAEPLELWPEGDESRKITFNGVWDADALPGTNEAQGDGVVIETRNGRTDRQSITIEAPFEHPDVQAARRAGTALPDRVWFQDYQSVKPDVVYRPKDGQTAECKKVIGTDIGMLSIRAVRTQVVRTVRHVISG